MTLRVFRLYVKNESQAFNPISWEPTASDRERWSGKLLVNPLRRVWHGTKKGEGRRNELKWEREPGRKEKKEGRHLGKRKQVSMKMGRKRSTGAQSERKEENANKKNEGSRKEKVMGEMVEVGKEEKEKWDCGRKREKKLREFGRKDIKRRYHYWEEGKQEWMSGGRTETEKGNFEGGEWVKRKDWKKKEKWTQH